MDVSSYWSDLIVLGILLLLSAFFSGTETALFAVNRLRLRRLDEEGNLRAGLVLRMLEDPGRPLTAILVGNNVTNVAASVLAALIFLRLFGPGAGPWVAILVVTVALLVIGEITPKTFASKYAERIALWAARPIYLLSRVLFPIIQVLSAVTNVFLRPLGARVDLHSPLVTEDEIKQLVKMGEEEGIIEQDEREMIHSIFEFGETLVREVMVPRIDMVCVEADATLDEVLEAVLQHGHSRIPVFEEDIDHIVGIAYVKDLLRDLKRGRLQVRARELMRPALFVPETKKVDDLFQELQRKKVHMAVVVDEFGGTAGLVTIEDLLEEIVGPIMDEYDVEERPVEIVDDRTAVVDARVHIEEVNEALGLDLPQEEVDTIGGFVYSLLGHVPIQGETVHYDGVEIRVERIDGQRIAKVKITKQAADPEQTRP
ncbi:MAG: HlyC/CorC family transporter [Armatimonadetes bacterium]|nr:HlyC/CorC family transporter [Armatimonadota bacterium]